MIGIEITGVAQGVKNIDRVRKGVPDAVEHGLDYGAEVVLGVAQRIVDVYTGPPKKGTVPGLLKESLHIERFPMERTVGTDVRYARFVEFGTSVMAPEPFLRPALDVSIEEIENGIAERIARVIEEAAIS
jgi:HK97 gp10 family phage protein